MPKKITLLSLDSQGVGDTFVADDATVSDAVNIATGTRDEQRWMAKVNGNVVGFSTPLNDGDRVLVVPVKVTGN